jgi:hypothetical protein
VAGAFSMILSAQELWRMRRNQTGTNQSVA